MPCERTVASLLYVKKIDAALKMAESITLKQSPNRDIIEAVILGAFSRGYQAVSDAVCKGAEVEANG